MNYIHSFKTFGQLVIIALMISSCSVNHTGLLPPTFIEGTRSEVSCPYTYTQLASGFGEYMEAVYVEEPLTIEVCTRGRPFNEIIQRACHQIIETYEHNVSERMSGNNYRLRDVPSVRPLVEETCKVLDTTSIGDGDIGSNIQMLSASGAFRLLHDNTGRVLGKNNFSKINAYIASSNIVVDVKYAVWRQGKTKARGSVQMDGGNCNNTDECPIVLRYLNLKIDNFKINRGIAGSDRVTDAKIYTLNNYEGNLNRDGAFAFNNVKLMMTGKVDGKSTTMLVESNINIHGKFKNYLGTTKVVPQTIEMRFAHADSRIKINMFLSFKTTKFEARFMNVGTGKCIRGILNSQNFREARASIESCTQKTRPQHWTLVKKRNYYQIMQPETNSCLNLKSTRENKEGGSVGIVNCSNHVDQLWDIRKNGKIVHSKTGKCLNVHRGRENRNGGYVSVYSCANTIDQEWKLIHTK